MLLDSYQSEDFFDEMFAEDGSVRPHYRHVLERMQRLDQGEYHRRQTAVDLAFMRGGVTFTVYNDNQGTERIFPFDLMPRVIPAHEWEVVEKGLIQRLTALNLFLHDIYHEQKILQDRIIPPHYINGAKHFRREFMHCKVPKDIYVHICGTDLIREGMAPTSSWRTICAALRARLTCWKTVRPCSAPFRNSTKPQG